MQSLNYSNLILIFFLFWSGFVSAKIDSTSVTLTNVSAYTLPTTSTDSSTGESSSSGNIKIYGGIAGTACATTADTTCDNCTGSNEPCNRKRIDEAGNLIISFTSDDSSVFTSQSQVKLLYSTTLVSMDIENSTIEANSAITVKIPWLNICTTMGLSDCSSGASTYKTFKLGIDKNADDTLDDYISLDIYVAGDSNIANYRFMTSCPVGSNPTLETYGGYCDVNFFAGDQKAYMGDEAHGENFNQAPFGVKYKYLRVFYEAGPQACLDANFTAVTNASESVDVSFSEGSSGTFPLDETRIPDLTNDQRYYFRFANVDEAGNVIYYSGDSTEANAYLNCSQHSVIPSEVGGLIDGKECFIATAAFGSNMSHELQILRQFRDQILKASPLGRWFVKSYYTYSPEWAQWLRKKESAKDIVRSILKPMTSMAQFALVYGIQSFAGLSVLGFLLGLYGVRRLRRRHG